MFKCLCRLEISLSTEREIVSHIDSCLQFNADSPLCRMMQKLQNVDLEQLITIKCDLMLQLQRVDAAIKSKKSKQDDFSLETYSKYTSKILNPQLVIPISEVIPETIVRIPKNPQESPQRIRQEHPQQLTQMIVEEQDTKLACEYCRKVFYCDRDFDRIWYLEECGHVLCRPCISRLAMEKYVQEEGKVLCPEISCGSRVTQSDFKTVLGLEKFAEIDRKLAMKHQSLAECCKCKSVFAFEKGNLKEQIKDNHGKLLVGQELLHYVSNRFKCNSCQTEQCKECHSVPYHINQTCETFKKNQQAQKCRLCEQPTQGDPSRTEAHRSICTAEDCQKRMQSLCEKKLDCGHFCSGLQGDDCFCLATKCSPNQHEDDYCNLCFTEALKSAPCIRSKCGHAFHQECLVRRLESKWNGPRIVFTFCQCPLCNQTIDVKNAKIAGMLRQAETLRADVQALCVERLEIENMKNAKELKDKNHQFYGKPEEFAMHIFCFYECFKCKKPYFGGLRNCAAQQENRGQFNKEDLICPGCCPISFESKCQKHGNRYIEFKCRFCCSIALWFCGGTTHYCDPCHSGVNQLSNKPCPGPAKCPLGVAHKPNGQECALGCALCRSRRVDDLLKQGDKMKSD